mgnify:CR=1 FL=1
MQLRSIASKWLSYGHMNFKMLVSNTGWDITLHNITLVTRETSSKSDEVDLANNTNNTRCKVERKISAVK